MLPSPRQPLTRPTAAVGMQGAASVTPFISSDDLPCLHAAAARVAQRLQAGDERSAAACALVLASSGSTPPPYAAPQAVESQRPQQAAPSFPCTVSTTLRVARATAVWLEERHPAEADPLAAPRAVAAWRARAQSAGAAVATRDMSISFHDAASEAFWTPRRGALSRRGSGTPWSQEPPDGAPSATSFASAASWRSARSSNGWNTPATQPSAVAAGASPRFAGSPAPLALAGQSEARCAARSGAIGGR
jgi:hypothetical protein